ncbi:MAG: hypothetical protein KAY24_19395, partial [Candidatus Eisenbacteria sp.]|nr:hypothetical protein [Candidatus Eisenbacteria bacterium]
MVGVLLLYNPSGLDPALRDDFVNRLKSQLTLMPHQSVERISTELMFCVCVHHGQLPSGGVAREGERILAVSGSCWIDPRASQLSTPIQILSAMGRSAGEGVHDFGGSFAIAHLDQNTPELTVLSDRFGTIPIYYRWWGQTLIVSSELKLLIDSRRDTLELEALAEMMAVGYLVRPHTLVAGIRRLPAHHSLVCNRQGLRIAALPTPGYPRNRPVDNEAIRELDSLVQRYLGRFVGVAPKYSIALSGGLDSRLLAMAAKRAGLQQVAFCVGEPRCQELQMATRVAEMLSIPIKIHEIEGHSLPDWFGKMVWFTEGRVLPNHMHYMSARLSGSLPSGPQLHGLVGEAIFGGAFDAPSLVDASPVSIQAACNAFAKGLIYWHKDTIQTSFTPQLAERVQAAMGLSIQDVMDRIGFTGRYENLLDFKWRFRVEGFTIPCLLSQVMPWTDVVSPFLDKDIFDFGATLETEGLKDRIAQIRWAMNHMPDVTRLPRVKDGVIIPIREDVPDAYERGIRSLKRCGRIKDMLCLLSRGRINLHYGLSFPIYGQWYRRWRRVRQYVDGILLSD